jgi:hypothetical protein
MILLSFLSVFLPGLNRTQCVTGQNGYTCSDLDSGLAALDRLLARPRSGLVRFVANGSTDADHLFARLFTVSFALATDSIPVLPAVSRFSPPAIASVGPASGPAPPFDFCKNVTSLRSRNSSWIVSSNPAQMLFNPTLARLHRELGPAALFILMHYTLNLTEPLSRLDYAVMIGRVNCAGYAGREFRERPQYALLMEAAAAAAVVQQLPSLAGFLVNLIRGEAPILFDPVGEACWRAPSYIAGGLNPLYPGTGRCLLDIARANWACADWRIVSEVLTKLI